MTSMDNRDLVAALRAVPGVLDAEVTQDAEGGLGQLRLDLEPGADDALVAGLVGRVLREQFGIGVDADRVQIVEDAVVEQFAASVPSHRFVRPSIVRMHLVSSGLDVVATVTLSSGDRTAVGEATGPASQTEVHRTVAAATLRAVEQLSEGLARFELDHVEVTPMGSERTALVSMTMHSALGSERLTGAAGVREDVRQAVIRATLDALNRRLEMLLSKS